MSLTYRLTLNRDAVKFVAKQEKAIQDRIRKSLLGLTVRQPAGDIKPLNHMFTILSEKCFSGVQIELVEKHF